MVGPDLGRCLACPGLFGKVLRRDSCQRDLVTDGETGWSFRANDPADLRAALANALEAVAVPAERERLRLAVRARVDRYTYAQTTSGLLAALKSVEATS